MNRNDFIKLVARSPMPSRDELAKHILEFVSNNPEHAKQIAPMFRYLDVITTPEGNHKRTQWPPLR